MGEAMAAADHLDDVGAGEKAVEDGAGARPGAAASP